MAAKPPLERAARALCSLAGNPENATMNGKPLWMDYLPEARAVIEAIREPSDGMVEWAFNHMEANGNDPRFAWEAMIDQLLAEGE
jgi:hypothetical protein